MLFNLHGAGFATILTQQKLDLSDPGVFILQSTETPGLHIEDLHLTYNVTSNDILPVKGGEDLCKHVFCNLDYFGEIIFVDQVKNSHIK